MGKRSFDQGLIIGLVSGGFVLIVNEIIQGLLRFSFTNVLSYDSNEYSAMFGGIVILLIALIVAIITKRKTLDFEQTWERNHESVVKYFLSMIDDDVDTMNWIFEKLKSEGFDFNKESSKLTVGDLRTVDYEKIKGNFNEMPLLQNVLGVITYEQYHAVYDYLKYSTMFVDLLDKQNYQKNLLELRSEQAKKILELFNGEEKNHSGLMKWKKHHSWHTNENKEN